MIIAIHQPQYLPWLGYLDKMDRCDIFVFLDHVQYEKQSWQKRNFILNDSGPRSLSLPIVKEGRVQPINEKQIANDIPWARKHWSAIHHAYSRYPYWGLVQDELIDFYDPKRSWSNLSEFNIDLTLGIARALGVDVPFIRSSELRLEDGLKKGALCGAICKRLGGTIYLSGDGARDYLEESVFEGYSIRVQWQNFVHPVYNQRRSFEFVPRMSVIDLLAAEGYRSLSILRNSREVGLVSSTPHCDVSCPNILR